MNKLEEIRMDYYNGKLTFEQFQTESYELGRQEVIEEINLLFKEHGSATIENKVDFANALILKLKTLTK